MRLQDIGYERVYSHTIADELGVSPEQVRKDFSTFEIKGNRKGGYLITNLLKCFEDIFGNNGDKRTVIVGMGNIGKAVANYRGFQLKNINIVAGFDIDPVKIRSRFPIPVYPVEHLPSYIYERKIRTAIIAVSRVSAREICQILVDYGVIGILNFSPIALKVPDKIIVNNINLCLELESIFYYTRKKRMMNE